MTPFAEQTARRSTGVEVCAVLPRILRLDAKLEDSVLQ